MAIQLSVDGDDYNQVSEYTIESVVYYINFRWNPRAGWIVSIYDEDNDPNNVSNATPLLAGLRCMPDGLLTWRYSKTSGLFTGDIVIVDTVYDGAEITEENFGDDRQYIPVYFTEEELEEYDFESFTEYST